MPARSAGKETARPSMPSAGQDRHLPGTTRLQQLRRHVKLGQRLCGNWLPNTSLIERWQPARPAVKRRHVAVQSRTDKVKPTTLGQYR
jgi:hypothetical protein